MTESTQTEAAAIQTAGAPPGRAPTGSSVALGQTRTIQIRSVHIRGPQPGQVATVTGILDNCVRGQWMECYVARFDNGELWFCPIMATKDYERVPPINEQDRNKTPGADEPREKAAARLDCNPTGYKKARPRLLWNFRLCLLLVLLVFGWRVGLVHVIKVLAEENPAGPNVFEDWDDGADDNDDDACNPPSANDGPEGGDNPCGMAVWRVSEPYINLWLEDTPLQYRLETGRWMPLKLSYKQRSSTRGTNYSGFGPNWECNWIELLRSTNGSSDWVYQKAGGGSGIMNINGSTVAYKDGKVLFALCLPGDQTCPWIEQAMLKKQSYTFPGQIPGLTDVTNRYLSERRDRYGRVTRFGWTNEVIATVPFSRLKTFVDRDGRTNGLAYNNSSFPSQITSVTDPYGRSASFTYNEKGWLTNITDMIGMSSSFKYDANGVITNLHTSYGDTGFRHFGSTTNINRAIEITEADGSLQLYAYRDNGTTEDGSAAGIYATTDDPNVRNSFHWNRAQFAALSSAARTNYLDMPMADYFKGSLKHWLLKSAAGYQINPVVSDTLGAMAGPVLEADPSTTRSGQVYFEYHGQSAYTPNLIGTLKRVTKIVWNDTTYSPGTSTAIDIGRNGWGRPTNIIYHYNGNDVGYTNNFDTDGRKLMTVIGPRGEAVRGYGYTNTVITNLLTSVTNAVGEVLRYTHDTNGMKVTSIAYPSGLLTTNFYYTTGTTGFLAKMIDVGFRTNSYSYTSGNVYIQTNELGLITTNSWDNLNRLISTAYPDGSYSSNIWDKLDLVGVKDRMDYWTRYKFNLVRQLLAVTNANGAVTEYQYCGCGSPSQITRWNGATAQTNTFNYNLAGQLTTATYPDSYQISFTYDALERMLTALDSGGQQVEFGYSDYDQVTAIKVGATDPRYWAVREFDEYGRLTNNIERNGVTTTNSYDVLGRVLSRRVIGALGDQLSGLETFEYNSRGLTNSMDALGKVTRFVRDQLSQPLYETNANSELLQFTYNPSGQLLTLTDGMTNTTRWGYDAEGRVTNKVDAASADMFRYLYDANARLTNRWQAGGISTTFRYDPVGNLTNIVYPTSSSIVLRYDALNRLTNMTDSIGSTGFTWTDGDQLASEDGPWASDKVSFGYNSRLRSTLTVQQPNASAWAQSYDYDTYRRLTNVTSSAGLFGTQYKAVSAGGVDMAADLVSRLDLPGGSYIENTQDDLGRLLSTVLKKADSTVLNSHAYAYNEGHQRTSQTFTAGNYVDYTYDNIGQLKTAKGKESGGVTNRLQEQFGYGYDAAWNLNKRTNNALIHTFNANNLNELTTITRANNYTVAGSVSTNPTSVTVKDNANSAVAATVYGDYTFARPNVTLIDGNNTFTAIAQDSLSRKDTNVVTAYLPATVTCYYDARGNLTNDGRRVFYYDDVNQLTSVTLSNAWRSEFAYDGMLRRRIRKEYTWQSSAWVKTNEVRYVYDDRVVVQERDVNNLALVTYTRGNDLSGSMQGAGGIGGLLARTDNGQMIACNGSANAYYHTDGNGNITALVNTNCSVVARYNFDPYGNLLGMSGPLAEANLYRSSSKEYHPNSGLVYYLYRYYEPTLQRWLNRDPINERGGINLFCFLFNSALRAVDLFGLQECDDTPNYLTGPLPSLKEPSLPKWPPVSPSKFHEPPSKNGLSDFLNMLGKAARDYFKDDISGAKNNLRDFGTDLWNDHKPAAIGVGLGLAAAAGMIAETIYEGGDKLEIKGRLFKTRNWDCGGGCYIQKSPDGGPDCGIQVKLNYRF